MLALILLFAAIVSLVFGARILRSRHRSPRPLRRFFGGLLVLFIAGAFLAGAVMASVDVNVTGFGPVVRVYLGSLPVFMAICFVLGLIGSSVRWGAGSTSEWGDDFSTESGVNPATGLPMIGGVDAAGNPYGVDLRKD